MSRNFDDASMDHRSCSCCLHDNAGTSSSVGGRDSFVEGVWLVPVVGLVSMRRALRVLQFLRTLSVLAGLGYPGAVGVAAVPVLKNVHGTGWSLLGSLDPWWRMTSCSE